LLDLEFARDADLGNQLGLVPEQTVMSWHDPSGTPEGIEEMAHRMLQAPARWLKVVPTATSLADLVKVLELHQTFNAGRSHERRLLTFAMGTVGLASRYLAPLLGPPVAFAAWSDCAPAAPGQLSITRTEAVSGHLSGAPQRLYGVVGADVSGSLSPALHGAGYRALALPYLLLPISVPDAGEVADLFGPRGTGPFDAIGLEFFGWAVTTPYKREAAAAADRHAPRVLRAGSANTLIVGEDYVTAENTDADGIVGSLVSLGFDPRGRTAVIQGTGGAARGAAVGLYLAGADVILRGRSDDRSKSVAESIGVSWCGPDETSPDSSILVNASPVGHCLDEPAPFSEQEIAQASAVVDMVYAAHATELVVRANTLDLPVADGRDVLLHQGIAQFAAFTQKVPPKNAMRQALQR
jgi:shikimate 5-dehydrogenase